MIRMPEALRWLNRFDRSHMNATTRGLLVQARSQRTDPAAIQDILRAALQQARISPQDGLDYPETLLNCAEIAQARGFLEQARDHSAAAIGSYVRASDVHGAAVAAWMLGITELALQATDGAYRNWKRSLRTFERYRQTSRHIPDTRIWYTEIAIRMNQDLVILPQESFSWLTRFEGSCISAVNHDLVTPLNDHISGGHSNEADRIINVMKERAKTSPDPFECAEIFAEMGLARFRMREAALAIKDLKIAVLTYPSESHQQECARWMLGAIQFWAGNQRVDALTNWDKTINGFTRLARWADQNNRPTQKRWYRDRIVYMKGALKGRMAEPPSGDTADFTPAADGGGGVGPPRSPHAAEAALGQHEEPQDRYQYLCSLVGGDQSVADGLIDYERQQMPNASRSELIERAIERLLDDRR